MKSYNGALLFAAKRISCQSFNLGYVIGDKTAEGHFWQKTNEKLGKVWYATSGQEMDESQCPMKNSKATHTLLSFDIRNSER